VFAVTPEFGRSSLASARKVGVPEDPFGEASTRLAA